MSSFRLQFDCRTHGNLVNSSSFIILIIAFKVSSILGGVAVRIQHKGIYHRNWLTPLWAQVKQVWSPQGNGLEGSRQARILQAGAEAGCPTQVAIQKEGPGERRALQTQQLLGISWVPGRRTNTSVIKGLATDKVGLAEGNLPFDQHEVNWWGTLITSARPLHTYIGLWMNNCEMCELQNGLDSLALQLSRDLNS